jgi:hypothetical protein
MPKVNFSKVENAFDKALQKLLINHISELAAIANVIQDPQANLASKTIEDIISRFQKELKKLKKQDSKLYERLNLSTEVEERFALPSKEFLQDDWLRLKELKLRIDELKHELYGQESLDVEYENQVSKERRRHINKRFNIRDGWLPLH